jgi:hypothetical protein
MTLDIPRDKTYPPSAVQCDTCGGHGCATCAGRGWFAEAAHPRGRRCENARCRSMLCRFAQAVGVPVAELL